MILENKKAAIRNSKLFLEDLENLQNEHGVNINSDSGDIYLSYKDKYTKYSSGWKWEYIDINWIGDGTELKVMTELTAKEIALSKLSEEDKVVLGIN